MKAHVGERPDHAAQQRSTPGPVPSTQMMPPYIQSVARLAYLWGWPLINMHNRRTLFQGLSEPGLSGGVLPVAPPNHLCMLHEYIEPQERYVACPNQDVVYGQGILSLDQSPVIVQVPDFGSRFWVYQMADQRTDGFGGLGKMYGSRPGFYLIVGPEWQGDAPHGVKKVFRSPTNLAIVIPRIFLDDTAEDRQAVLPLVNQIMAYPLSQYTGHIQTRDWTQLPTFPSQQQSGGEIAWVKPEAFFDTLPAILQEVPPLPGEEALYGWFSSILLTADHDQTIKQLLQQIAVETEHELIDPLIHFRHVGIPLKQSWTTIRNGAAFGTDYLTRTAVARSNIFVNQPQETSYFYQEYDGHEERLHGNRAYQLTFSKESLPPARGFWSLTLYDNDHFFVPNPLKRYSLGTKNKDLQFQHDGSLTLFVQATAPEEAKRTNWLPAPKEETFALYLRVYWPQESVLTGQWVPPAVTPV